jgi:hypothetical protein
VKIKKFLETQKIAYDPASDPSTLKGMAKARMKRIIDNAADPASKKRLFEGKSTPLSIAELNVIIASMLSKNKDVEGKHLRAMFTIDEVSGHDITVRKHMLGWGPNVCSGLVEGGQCKRCNEYVNGVGAYTFKVLLTDLNDSTATLPVKCAQGAGTSLFGNVEFFHIKTDDEKKDKIDYVMCVPYSATVILKYTAESKNLMVSMYDVKREAK